MATLTIWPLGNSSSVGAMPPLCSACSATAAAARCRSAPQQGFSRRKSFFLGGGFLFGGLTASWPPFFLPSSGGLGDTGTLRVAEGMNRGTVLGDRDMGGWNALAARKLQNESLSQQWQNAVVIPECQNGSNGGRLLGMVVQSMYGHCQNDIWIGQAKLWAKLRVKGVKHLNSWSSDWNVTSTLCPRSFWISWSEVHQVGP